MSKKAVVKFEVVEQALFGIINNTAVVTDWVRAVAPRKKANEQQKDYSVRLRQIIGEIIAKEAPDRVDAYLNSNKLAADTPVYILDTNPTDKKAAVLKTLVYRVIKEKFEQSKKDDPQAPVIDAEVTKRLTALVQARGWDKAQLLGFLDGMIAAS